MPTVLFRHGIRNANEFCAPPPPPTYEQTIPVPDSEDKNHPDVSPGKDTIKKGKPIGEDPDGLARPFHFLIIPITIIIVGPEVWEKSLLVAALVVMKKDRLLVDFAASGAILFTVLGYATTTFIPKKVSNFLAATLFLIILLRLILTIATTCSLPYIFIFHSFALHWVPAAAVILAGCPGLCPRSTR